MQGARAQTLVRVLRSHKSWGADKNFKKKESHLKKPTEVKKLYIYKEKC